MMGRSVALLVSLFFKMCRWQWQFELLALALKLVIKTQNMSLGPHSVIIESNMYLTLFDAMLMLCVSCLFARNFAHAICSTIV